MFRYACVAFVILGSFLVSAAVSEETREKLKKQIEDNIKTCTKEFGVSLEDVRGSKNKIDDVDPCLIACFFKANKLIDDKGMFDTKEATVLAERVIKNPDELAKIKKNTETCKSVNDEKVSDGENGCERSMLLMQCFIKNDTSDLL